MPLCAPTRGTNLKAIRAPKPRAAAGGGAEPHRGYYPLFLT